MRTALFLAILFCAHAAVADSLQVDSGVAIREVSHEVTARFPAVDLVELTVRRSFANTGDRAGALSLSIELPEGAVVTAMRTRSGSIWHRAVLLEADVAVQRYESQPAGVPDQDTALLVFGGAGRVELTAASVPARGALAVEYTLRAPAIREAGRLRAHYQFEASPDLVAPVVRVDAPGRAWIDGAAVVAGAPRVLSARAPSAGPSSVSSLMKLPSGKPARSGVVRAFISHDSPTDLAVDVVNAEGHRQRLIGPESSRALETLRAGVALEPAMVGELGELWKLVVTDTSSGTDGVLHSWRLDVVDVDGASSVHRVREPARIPDAVISRDTDPVAAIIEVARDPKTLVVRHGRALFAGGKSSVSRLHIDAPDAFAKTPRDLFVVFVIDASRSLSSEEISAQLDVAAAYLKAAPNARFELVRFDRRARRLLGRFAAAGEMPSLRAALVGQLARANGSHLERGLALAARTLGAERRRHRLAARVVVLSDGLMRSRFDNAMGHRALRRAPRHTVAHYVEARGVSTAGADQRLDKHPLAPIAAATGGMAIAVDPEADAAELARSALHLVRPIRVDHFAVTGPFSTEVAERGPLYEGTGLRLASVLDKAGPSSVAVTGLVWAKPLKRAVPAGRRDGDLAAGLLFGGTDHIGLDDADVKALALRGQVVSPATSLLTVGPGEREPIGWGGWGFGSTCSACAFGTIGHGIGAGKAREPITLLAPLRRCAERLGPTADLSARVELETSGVEIVDVRVSAAAAETRACLTEAIWAHELRPIQADGPLARYVIELDRSMLSAPAASAPAASPAAASPGAPSAALP